MNIAITILVCFFAGLGAGLGTGFAGMSAAAVITPMLVTFLGMETYDAVGIGEDYPWSRGTVEVPVWFWEGRAVWGMTARLIRDLAAHL